MSRAMRPAAYNSRIPYMLTPFPSRYVGSCLIVMGMLLALRANAQNWAGAEEQLAGKIVAAIGPKTMAVEVLNRSSLSGPTVDDLRRNLLTQIALLGGRFAAPEQAAASVRVSLSEDLQSYLWIVEIRQATNSPPVVMVSLPRSVPLSVEPQAVAVVLRRIPLWSQPDRILDVAVIDGTPARMWVLDANAISSFRLQDNRWQMEQAFPVTHSRPWPRDLRGRLVRSKDNLFDAYLPSVHCRSSAGTPPAIACYDSDEPWPLGNDLTSLNASFTSTRNFFGGILSPGAGKQTTAPAFYSAASVPRGPGVSWLLAAVDGQVHFLDGSTDQVAEKLGWGSDIASVHSGCGSGWQVLASAPGDGRSDVVRVFEVAGTALVAAGAPLDVSGGITAMWSESGGSGAVAIAHNFESGRYEAFRLILTCGR